MPLQFTQEEVEDKLADVVKRATREEIARGCGLSESYIKRQFNPHDEQASCMFRVLQIACTLDDLDEAMGDEFIQTILEFRELSKKRKSIIESCLAKETASLNKEIADFVSAKLEGKSYEVQFKELLEAETQLNKVKQKLIDEYNRLKESAPEPKILSFSK